jgi:hypothetical protein
MSSRQRHGVVDPEEAARLLSGTADEEAAEEIPAVTTIELDVRDARGRRYQGKFHYHVPTIGDQIKMGQIKTVMLPQGSPSDVNAAVLVDTLAYLQVCITFNEQFPKPAWWKPMALYDATPFSELFRRCLDYEAKFHGRGPDARGDEDGAPGAEERGGSGELPVGRKVQAPAQRRETLAGDGSGRD